MPDASTRKKAAIIGPLGPAQLACIRSWKATGMEVVFFHIATKPLKFFAGSLADYYVWLPQDEFGKNPTQTSFLQELNRHAPAILTCLSYNLAGTLNKLSNMINGTTRLAVPTPQSLVFMDDKKEQIDLARNLDFDVLETYYIDKSFDRNATDIRFPIVLRPTTPGSVSPSFKAEIIDDVGELVRFLDSRTSISNPLVAQEFVSGPNIVIHGARSGRTGQCVQSGFIVNHKFEGVTLSMEPFAPSPALLEKTKKFCEQSETLGVYHFEFIHDPIGNKSYFLEINGRLGGTTGKAFRLGFDEPAFLFQCYDEDSGGLDEEVHLRNEIASNKKALLKYFIYVLMGKISRIDFPNKGRLSLLWLSLKGMLGWKDENFRTSDIRRSLAALFAE